MKVLEFDSFKVTIPLPLNKIIAKHSNFITKYPTIGLSMFGTFQIFGTNVYFKKKYYDQIFSFIDSNFGNHDIINCSADFINNINTLSISPRTDLDFFLRLYKKETIINFSIVYYKNDLTKEKLSNKNNKTHDWFKTEPMTINNSIIYDTYKCDKCKLSKVEIVQNNKIKTYSNQNLSCNNVIIKDIIK